MASVARPDLQTQAVDDRVVVLGVDTHAETHTAAVVTGGGVLLDVRTFPATHVGYEQMLSWARGYGSLGRAGVECTGSYGKALTRHLNAAGIEVIEVSSPDKATRRRRGKTDALDAEAAALSVLNGRAAATPKAGDGPVEMIRMFKLAKSSAIKARTQAINQLKAVLVAADPTVRQTMATLSGPVLIRRCAQLQATNPRDITSAATYTLRLLASRILDLTAEINDLTRQITDAITAHTPSLLERTGVGPDCAAAFLLAAGDNPDRLTGEASYAALCGASPVEASSGKSQRARLNRGGDRQANAALYRVVITRMRWDERTRTYVERRTAQGKTRREIIRCLKRYVAREIYQIITRSHTTPTV